MSFILKNTIGIWLILTLLILPFPYFLVNPIYNYSSDSIFIYYLAGITILLSILTSIFHQKYKFLKQDKLEQFLYVTSAYILSYFLLKYGFDKLLLRQFYTPESNTLFSTVGSLSKDILFWTSMGTSKAYNIFMGIIEIIPGLLLLHTKTRVFGAFIAFGVLLNVFMINVGFDISVKLLSLYLLIAATFLLMPVLNHFLDLFIRQRKISVLKPPHLLFSNNRLKKTIKAMAITLILLDVISPYLAEEYSKELKMKMYSGSYEIKTKGAVFLNHSIKRIHIHSNGYFILEDFNSQFQDYKFTLMGKSIYLLKEKITIELNRKENTMSWEEDSKSKYLKFNKIDSNSIPLLKDDFHWTVDGIIESTKTL